MKEKNPEISNILEYIIYHATYTIFTLLAIWNASENTKTNLTLKTEQKESTKKKKNCDKRAHILIISSSLQSPNNSAVTPLFLSLLFDDSFHHHGLYYWQFFLIKSQFYKTILHFLSEAILQKHFQNSGKRIWINEKLNVRGVIVLLTFFQFLFWIFFISVPCFPNCALLCSHILGRSKIKLQGWC